MSLRSELRRAVFEVAGSRPASWAALAASKRNSLRVLAYHEVPDPTMFEQQMRFVSGHFETLSAEDVVEGRRESDHPAVWVTFDDGDRTVAEVAQPILDQLNIRATAFICPAFVDKDEPFWWDLVSFAFAHLNRATGLDLASDEVERMKRAPDDVRRERLAQIADTVLNEGKKPPSGRHMTSGQLAHWTASGHTLGNHTWDHPILDMCSASAQRSQIERAHEMIAAWSDGPLLFAYPNGNGTEASLSFLRQLDYDCAVLFDHRIDHIKDPLRMSRIRVNAYDPLPEFKAKVTGIHPVVHRLRKGT